MEVTCNKCGRVHFVIPRTDAQRSVNDFNNYFDTLSEEDRQKWYGGNPSSIEQYEHCFSCGNTYKDFRVSKDDDAPLGVTIQPIIHFDES